MDSAAKVRLRRVPALAELFDSLGGMNALSTLAELMDALPVGVAVIGVDDASFPVLYLNSRAWNICAAEAGEVIGRPLGEALSAPDEVIEAVREAHQRRGRRKVRYRPNLWQIWDFEATSLRQGRGGPAGVLATWQEVQERAVDAERTQQASELSGSLDPAKVMDRMLRRAADEADADLVVLLRREEDELVPEVGFDRGDVSAASADRISLAGDQASRRALELGRPVIRSPEPLAGDPNASPRLHDLRHSARVPLHLADEPSDLLLLLGRRRGGPFTRYDATLLEVLARQAAIAIRNARLYERAEKAARRLQVGVDVALEVATHLEPEEVIERVLHRALEAVEAERATVGRMDGEVRCTILGSVDRGDEPAPVGLTVSLESQVPAVQAIATRRPAQGRIAYEKIGMRPLGWSLVIPLVAGGELIALLAVSRDRRQFDDEEVAVLQQIGAIAALAFKNATLFQSLRDASRVRSQFLNMAAHELRTPLAVIGGYLSMLADGTLGPAPARWEAPLSVLFDKSRELAHLIDDILLAGRLDGGIARTTVRSMDLSESLGDAIRRAGPRAELLAADLKMRAPHSVVRVWADPDHVGRVLDNLVNNAFNYSPAPPRVTLTMVTEAESAVVRVEDSGRGVAPDNRDRIFQQFFRVDDPADGYPPGTGLGLFISRALAERYGGSLELEWSELGVGSRFALRLPLAPSA